MPVFYTPIPQNLRMGLANISGSVFINNRTRDSRHFRDPYQDHEVCAEVSSHLPLQMLLYFNIFFPFWWISKVLMLHLKFCYLPAYYQCLLVTGMVLISIFEVLRAVVYKVPEKLAGFWLISFLFFITDEVTIILPLERAIHSLYLGFLLGELPASFLALHVMTRKLAQQFHMRQFALPLFGLSYGGRSVLPVRDIQPH
uniref:Transmembrane protein 17A-like n=1 Tax=Sinocyclocheilus grahami TaxID=75366 RepID=A0A672QY19_SINGR